MGAWDFSALVPYEKDPIANIWLTLRVVLSGTRVAKFPLIIHWLFCLPSEIEKAERPSIRTCSGKDKVSEAHPRHQDLPKPIPSSGHMPQRIPKDAKKPARA